jgi:hypothetical protein
METTMPKATATSTTPLNDPVIVLLAQHEALSRRLEDGDGSDDCNILAGMVGVDEQLAATKAITAEGALAALRRLKAELQEFVLAEDAPQSQLYLGLIEGVASYLRRQTGVVMAS